MNKTLFGIAICGSIALAGAATLHDSNPAPTPTASFSASLADQPNYPGTTFFIGVGSSPASQAEADNMAMVQLQKQITVTLRSNQEIGVSSKRQGNKEEIKRWFESRNTVNTSGNLQGAEIIIRNKKDNSFYSVAALNKAKFAAQKRMNMTDAAKAVTTLATQAKADADANKLADALASRSRIEERVRFFESERRLLSAAEQLTAADTLPVNIDALSTIFDAALKKLSIEAASGAKQNILDPSQGLLPWIVKVSAAGMPVAEMPLKLVSPDRKVVRTAITDADGQAVFFPDAFIGRSSGEQIWKVIADLQVTRAQSDIVDRKRAEFSVTITPPECKVKLSLSGIDNAAARNELIKTLASYGFKDDGTAKKTLSASTTVEQKGYSQGLSDQSTFVMQEVTLNLAVTDVAGRTLQTTLAKAVGMGNKDAAMTQALQKMQLGPDASQLSKAACGDGSPAKPLPTLAILPFSAPRTWYSDEAKATLLTDMVAGSIHRIEAYQIVERTRLNDIVTEQTTGQAGLIADPVEMGQLLGAQYIMMGTLLGDWDNIKVEGRVVDTKTGAVVKTFSAAGSLEQISDQVAKQLL